MKVKGSRLPAAHPHPKIPKVPPPPGTGTSYPPPLASHVVFPRPYADGFTPNLSGDSAAASVPYADQRVFQETTLVRFLRSKALLLCSRARKVRKR